MSLAKKLVEQNKKLYRNESFNFQDLQMAFFSQEELETLAIEQMAFHLVGPEEKDLLMLEAFKPGDFSEFFLDRIISVNAGVPYVFSDASSTRERLRRISTDNELFQEESEKLAADFQRLHAGSALKGAFLVMRLTFRKGEAFALLKNDDEKVISYAIKDGRSGRKRVALDAIEQTFVENPEALQKSALVRLSKSGGDIAVLDRRNQQKVARYFENFLGAIRQFDDDELTAKFVDVARNVIRSNKDLVPEDVYRELGKRTYVAASGQGKIDANQHKTFLDSVLGQKLADDHPLVRKFSNALKTARIDSIPIQLNVAKVTKPVAKKFVTKKQIQIRVPIDVEKFIRFESDRIVILDRLESQVDETK